MSELTTPIRIDIPGVGSIESADLYLKSEADKVIAEKDAKILALDAEVFKQKHHAKLFLDERNYAETQLRHHKYKRCLAMAKWCHNQREIYERDSYDWELEYAVKCSLWNKAKIMRKWRERWLELAEKFKEAK